MSQGIADCRLQIADWGGLRLLPIGRVVRTALVALTCFVGTWRAPASAEYLFGATRPETLKVPALRFTPPEPVKRTLPNGMTLYLMEDRELPLLNVQAYVKTGSVYDPPGKTGLADLTGTVMRTGGSEKFPGDVIDRKLESVGGSLEVSVSDEYAVVGGSSLSKDADTLLDVLSEVMRRPAFPQAKLELAKQQMLEGIRRRNDEPSAIASRAFAQAVYGKESPWARQPSIAEVSKLSRDDLVDFHARTFAPNSVILAMSADMSVDEMVQRLQRWLGDWPKETVQLPPVAPVETTPHPGVTLVTKAVDQANIRVGHLGIPRNTPEMYAVRVMNQILGLGDFSSRLVREIRTSKGLAYSVWGYLGEGRDRGLFEMGAETKVESTRPVIDNMRQILSGMIAAPVSPAELKDAKDSLINSFVGRFTSPFRVASQRAMLDMIGFPADYLPTYTARVGAVTAADVQAAAKKYLRPADLAIVVVGPPTLSQSLQGLGPLRTTAPEE